MIADIEVEVKKAYEAPKLEIYGRVADITQLAPGKGGAKADGGGPTGTKA